ncbi:hypothetical protein L2E82_05773 [Cichorium intybus]|uniref:Uncharacterized protein n=1 Tax=Cichorium intybus TaxID=13427 RepID=A0ACB9HAD7_CICIN|nr:hypothetical protein L2E82_05773 [Cichorium intybus]
MARRLPQFPCRSIPANFHLSVDRILLCSDFIRVICLLKLPLILHRIHQHPLKRWTVENATKLGLKGWVWNRANGSVEALFSGDADKVEAGLERFRTWPSCAIITKFDAKPSDEDPGTGFERRPHGQLVQ